MSDIFFFFFLFHMSDMILTSALEINQIGSRLSLHLASASPEL